MATYNYNGSIVANANGETISTGILAIAEVPLNLLAFTTIFGQGGDDVLIGGGPSSFTGTYFGSPYTIDYSGNDRLYGGDGNDSLSGGAGNDILAGDAGNDTLNGGTGNDSLEAGSGNDILNGGDGNDTLTADGGPDLLSGDAGDDLFQVGGNLIQSTISGGTGNDTVSLNTITLTNLSPFSSIEFFTNPGSLVIQGTADIDTLDFSGIAWTGSWGAPTIFGYEGNDLLGGTVGNDRLYGGDGNDSLSGGAGNDILAGDAGNDTLNGGTGNDSLDGGVGDDAYFVDNAADVVTESVASVGTDVVWSSAPAYQLPDNIEIAYLYLNGASLTGSAAAEQLVANAALASTINGAGGDDTLWGSPLADTLIGGTGDDTLRSQGGADTLTGNGGNDQFVISNAAAIVIEAANEGYDTVWVDTTGYVIPDNIEVTRLVASNATLTGNAGANVITTAGTNTRLNGMAGNDELWGSSGPDTLDGGTGDDILRGQGGADTFIGGTGNDQFVVFSAAATILENQDEGYDVAWIAASGFTLAGNIEVGRLIDQATSLTGSAMGENLVANQALGSTLNGMGGNDILWGSTQADIFDGGTQDDIIYSYGGADRFRYASTGWGFDQISGFDRAQGMKIDMTGLGTSFAALQPGFQFGGGNGQITLGADRILVYGVTSFQASDFLF